MLLLRESEVEVDATTISVVYNYAEGDRIVILSGKFDHKIRKMLKEHDLDWQCTIRIDDDGDFIVKTSPEVALKIFAFEMRVDEESEHKPTLYNELIPELLKDIVELGKKYDIDWGKVMLMEQ